MCVPVVIWGIAALTGRVENGQIKGGNCQIVQLCSFVLKRVKNNCFFQFPFFCFRKHMQKVFASGNKGGTVDFLSNPTLKKK